MLISIPRPSPTGRLRGLLAATTALSAVGSLAFGRARWRRTHYRLLDMEVQAETAEVRERLRAADVGAYRHELINCLAAIEGAATILERETFEADRAGLHRMLAAEIGHLRDLVDSRRVGVDRVSLSDAAAELATEPAWRHLLHLDVAPDLVATGSPGQTKEAVRQVLGYVGRNTSAERLTLRGRRTGDWIGLWVDDAHHVRSRRRRRALHGLKGDEPFGPDFPLALHVAARLMRGQEGDLRVEAGAGGALSFGACLPAAPDGPG